MVGPGVAYRFHNNSLVQSTFVIKQLQCETLKKQ